MIAFVQELLWAWPTDWRMILLLVVTLILCGVAWHFEIYGSDD